MTSRRSSSSTNCTVALTTTPVTGLGQPLTVPLSEAMAVQVARSTGRDAPQVTYPRVELLLPGREEFLGARSSWWMPSPSRPRVPRGRAGRPAEWRRIP
ncbi:hypothetical protein ACWGI9_16170 [Streptomyces sp. NPDC054833]